MPADRSLWLLGTDPAAQERLAVDIRALGRVVTVQPGCEIDLVAWASAGWPLLACLVSDDGRAIGTVLRRLARALLRPPVLALTSGPELAAALVRSGVTDVIRWPADAEMLAVRLDLLDRRSPGESLLRKQLADAGGGFLYVYDYDLGRLAWVSPTAGEVLGANVATISTSDFPSIGSLLHPEDLPAFRARNDATRTLQDGEVLVEEYRMRSPTGDWRWIRVRGVVVERHADGNARRLLGLAEDVSAWRAPGDALRAMVEGTSAVGDPFFRGVARELARFLGARWVLVGEVIRAEGEILRSAAFCEEGAVLPPIELSLPGSAGEEVAQGNVVFRPTGAREEFPSDPLLARLGADGYLGVPVLDAGGVTIGMLVAMHDAPMPVGSTARSIMTAFAARVGAELARARWDRARGVEDERLRLATEASRMAVWDWDVVTDELVWKGEVAAIFGDPAILEARNPSAFWERVHPEDFLRGRAEFQQALDGEARLFTELRFRRPDGTVRWLDCHGQVYRDAAGRPVRMIGTALDATERRQAGERLRASEQRLQLAIGGAKAGLWDWDFVAGTLYYSPEWERMVGYAAGELPAHVDTWKGLVHPDDREAVSDAMVAHLKGATDLYETEHRLRHREGHWVWVLDRGRVVDRGPDGRALRMTGIQTDISERRKLETQLLLADRMTTVGTLAKGVAHEINNPLAYVIGNLEYLLTLTDGVAGSGAAGRFRRALSEAIEGAERVRTIIADLKTFSRSDEPGRRPILVGPVVEAALRIVHNEMRHIAVLEKEILPTPPVLGAEGRLGQVFVNLFTNALQSMPPSRSSDQNRVRVSVTGDDAGHVIVEIEDNGEGMTAEVMRRIFDPFFTTRGVGEATGLGLTACHNVVTGMGGRLEVESAVGRGSRFRVVLPASSAIAQPEQPEPTEGTAGTPRVLVIDDEPMVAGVIRAMLRDGHEVVLVESGGEALARIGAGARFDAIVCDVMMPSMTGMAVYEELLRLDPGQAERTGFITGGVFTRSAAEFLQGMAGRVIEKPFDAPTLRRFVRSLIDRG